MRRRPPRSTRTDTLLPYTTLFRSETQTGPISWQSFNLEAADNVMHRAMHHGSTIYSAAYIMPMPSMGSQKKHSNHLRLLEKLMKDGIAGKILAMRSLRELYELLVSVERSEEHTSELQSLMRISYAVFCL